MEADVPDDPDIITALDAAIDAVLKARVEAGGLASVALPNEALDSALVHDAGAYRRSLRQHRRAYDKLRQVVDPDHRDMLVDLADGGNAMASASAEIGFRLGVTLARAGGAS